MREKRHAHLFKCFHAKYDKSRAVIQGDHLFGKPGNVREFDSCQGNVGDFTKNQGNVREKWPKTVCYKLHICIHAGI